MRRDAAYSADTWGIVKKIKGSFMTKKLGVRVGILTVIFIVAVIFFDRLTNKKNEDLSAAMESATLPTVSFVNLGYEVNPLYGYVNDMEIPSVRDTLTMVEDETLQMSIRTYGAEIQKITWQVFSLDGKDCLQKETIEGAENCTLKFYDNGMLSTEKVLKITLHMPQKDIYYYTRIKDDKDCNYQECLDFVKRLQEQAFYKQDTETLEGYLESVSGGDNEGFHKVTIASSLKYVTWGELSPELLDNITWEIKECNETYTALVLSYRVKCPGAEEVSGCEYSVEEFYRVRAYNGKMYLMDYERTMEQFFGTGDKLLTEKGILVGIGSDALEYQYNESGTKVAFVQNNELWTYDKEEDTFSMVFSFADAEKEDARNYVNRHEIHVDSIDEQGNVLFYVLGYMNRGKHEGQTGVAIYSFEYLKNAVEEKAFVPSKKGYEIMEEELGSCIHYNAGQNILYVMMDGYLYRVDMEENTKELLVRGLKATQYVLSETGDLLLYQSVNAQKEYSDKIRFLNLDTGKEFEICAGEGEYICPLGFINSDIVYGIMKNEDEGSTLTGENILPMYKLEIMTQEQEIVKTYQAEGIYIQGVTISEHVVALQRVVKSDASYYTVSEDYITSNEEVEESNITLTAITEDIRGKVQRITFADGISDKEAKILKPKFTLKAQSADVAFDEASMKGKFYVYARGHLQGSYENAGEAIREADNLRAVVISSKQAYVWERGNWPNADEVESVAVFEAAEQQSTLEACIAKILEKEGAKESVDVAQELGAGKTIVEILSTYTDCEGMDLTGCSVEELQYTLSKETPVIAIVGENQAVLLTEYNKNHVIYIDPTKGSKEIVTKETMERMAEPYGSVFIGYVK